MRDGWFDRFDNSDLTRYDVAKEIHGSKSAAMRALREADRKVWTFANFRECVKLYFQYRLDTEIFGVGSDRMLMRYYKWDLDARNAKQRHIEDFKAAHGCEPDELAAKYNRLKAATLWERIFLWKSLI